MIYTRNKESFKKTTQKVQHNIAQANILSLVKDLVNKKGEVLPENQPRNIEIKKTPFEKQTLNNPPHHRISIAKNVQPSPKLCESRYQTSKQTSFTIEHIFDYTLKAAQHGKSSNKAHKEYLQLLEEKITALQETIDQKDKEIKSYQSKIQKQQKQLTKEDRQKSKLMRFYHQSRTCLVLMSAELIQCKKMIVDFSGNEENGKERIKALNKILNKSEQILEVYRSLIQLTGQKGDKLIQKNQILDLEKMKETSKYQQKTIDFFRNQNKKGTQFNELRLLRHQINRLSNENQKLMKKLAKTNDVKTPKKQKDQQNEDKNSSIKKKIQKMEQKLSFEHSQQMEKIKKQFQSQIYTLKQKLVQKSDLAIKYKEQKQCLIQFLDQARDKSTQLQSTIRGYQQQIHYLTKKMGNQEKLYFDKNKEIASTEEFMKALKPFPRYQKLLVNIVNIYEQKISLLQQKVIQQRSIKQKFMQWSGSVYRLLQSTNISKQTLQKHMQDLYSMDKIMDDSNIQRYLRQIRSLSVGVDENQIREMESELEEYIVSLKSRNQVIKEVDIEDGSSVAMSETFTDREFDDLERETQNQE